MSSIDLENLLAPLSDDAPCGEDLEYDPAFIDMELTAAGKPEQQFGDTVIPAEEPDWGELRSKSLKICERTRDLRAAMYLTRASVQLQGLAGLRDALALLHGLVTRHWEAVHPQLDPEDDNDPTLRINTIMALRDPQAMLQSVRDTVLVRSRGLGSFSYRDFMIANGEMSPIGGGSAPDMATIDGAFADADLEQLQLTEEAIRECLEYVRNIEQFITEQVGAANAPNLSDLTDLLRDMHRVVNDRLKRRGVFDEGSAADAEPSAEDSLPSEGNGDGATALVRSAVVARGVGEVASREDVIRAIDRICEYYARYEPSSPVPLLLNRAKRLASKSFLEILRDLTPEALQQAMSIGGISDDSMSSGSNSDNDV